MKRTSASTRKKSAKPARTGARKPAAAMAAAVPKENLSVFVSKTIAAPVAAVFAAWKDSATRALWLPVSGLTLRKATPHKSIRIIWPDGTPLSVNFWPKGALRSQVVPLHDHLADAATVEKMKHYWNDRLEALRALLEKKT